MLRKGTGKIYSQTDSDGGYESVQTVEIKKAVPLVKQESVYESVKTVPAKADQSGVIKMEELRLPLGTGGEEESKSSSVFGYPTRIEEVEQEYEPETPAVHLKESGDTTEGPSFNITK